MKFKMMTILLKQVSARINLKTDETIPKFGKLLVDFVVLKANFDRKCRLDAELQKQKDASGSPLFETLRKMTFSVSTMNSVINFI
jgi:hypothetical protein